LEDVNHDELGDHTRTAAEDADSADAEASISEGLLPVQSSSVETASPKLAEELSPSDSGTIVQTERETLPNKPDEHDA